MNRKSEKGIALIMALIMLSILTVIGVSFLFLAQSETWSSMNYRIMSQARDGAEAGINSATNYLVNTYATPGSGTGCASDVLGCYTMTSYPVQWASNSAKIVGLSSTGSSAPSSLDYPVSSVKTAFDTNGVGYGSVTFGSTTVNYATYAKLLALRQIGVYGGTNVSVPTWLIVSDGSVNNGVRSSQVEVSAILEPEVVPTFTYAAFGTSNQCAALTFSQAGTLVESYDSSTHSGTAAPTAANGTVKATDGNVGTNGNLTISSNATIDGSLSTPAVGTGSCVNGATGASTAETACGGCTLAGGIIELPQPIVYPTPTYPGTYSLTAQSGNNDCGSGGSAIPNCTLIASKKISIAPGNYGNLTIGSSMNEVHLTTGAYNMNSFAMANAALIIDSGPVTLNIAGCATLNAGSTACATELSTTVVDFTSTGLTNTTYIASNLKINYGGTNGIINVKCGNTGASAVVYAPNAAVTMSSNGSFYGAVIGKTVTVSSGATIYYDRALQDSGYTVGNYVLGGFSWKKF